LLANALEFAKEHGYDGLVSYNAIIPKGVKLNRLSDRVQDSEYTLRNLYTPNGPLKRVPRMTICCFNPHDIKSAVGNSGEFGDTEDIGKSLLLLAEFAWVPSLFKSIPAAPKKGAPKPGETIRYRHPNHPTLVRQGRVLCSGGDGCLVLHHPSGHEERVRFADIVKGEARSIAKSLPATRRRGAPDRQQEQSRSPLVRRLPYEVGHAVAYQRPDMAEPRVGRVDTMGAHGAVVSLANGARHKVRWEHIQGRAQAGIDGADRGEVLDTLKQMGLPVDELDALLSSPRKPRGDSRLLDQLTALAAGGAPIDTKRASRASRATLERLRDHLTVTERAM
jgi:hypothetical protein